MVRVSGVLYRTEHDSGGLMPCRQYRVRAGGVAVTEYEIDMTSLDNINQSECVVSSLLPGRPVLCVCSE